MGISMDFIFMPLFIIGSETPVPSNRRSSHQPGDDRASVSLPSGRLDSLAACHTAARLLAWFGLAACRCTGEPLMERKQCVKRRGAYYRWSILDGEPFLCRWQPAGCYLGCVMPPSGKWGRRGKIQFICTCTDVSACECGEARGRKKRPNLIDWHIDSRGQSSFYLWNDFTAIQIHCVSPAVVGR